MRNADAANDLDQELRTIFAERLLSLVVYGASATSEAPVATMAIVEAVGAPDLRACAERVEAWHRRGLATPLVMAADEFARSLDAFPFEFGAILSDYDVVSGADPFAGLSVDPADLRRACEVQARSHLLHLRQGFLETGGRPDRIGDLIVRSAPALVALLTHVRRLVPAFEPARVLGRVGELAPQGTLSPDEGRRLFPEYLQAVGALVDQMDRWGQA